MMKRCSSDRPCAFMSAVHRATIERSLSSSDLPGGSAATRFSLSSLLQLMRRPDHEQLRLFQNTDDEMILRENAFGKLEWAKEFRIHFPPKALRSVSRRRCDISQ